MRYKYQIISSVILLVAWQLGALLLNQPFLYPRPDQIVVEMGNQIGTSLFYESMIMTSFRAICGFAIAGLLAFSLAYISFKSSKFKRCLAPILLVVRAIPNITYIIIILIYFGSEVSTIIIGFFIVFPTMYSQFFEGFNSIDIEHEKVLKSYKMTFFRELFKFRVPLINSFSKAACRNGCSLAIKVGVMAEILGAIQVGVGRQMLLDKIAFNMSGVIAWSIWMVLLLFFLDLVVKRIFDAK